jgi:alkanesulfonate monooxygenase SsuD/methylene tetrahydromethanopterin reductase-like flavin-dependent oxidoreductase (luciferase family)
LTHLTGGRFEAGIVSGIPPELGVAGVPMPVASARHAAIADVLDSLADDPIITQHTDEWNINELELFPRWDRTRGLWTACRSKDSAERAGRRGWKVCGGFNSTAVLAEMFDGYRKAAESAGHEVDDSHLAIRRMVTFVDLPSQQREGMHTAKRSLLGLLNASAGPLPPFAALLDRPDESIDMLSNDEFVSGTPDQVADELINQCREVGASNVMVMFSAVERDELEHAHRLFAEHVIPHLQNASLV